MVTKKTHISAAGNTEVPSYLVLTNKGYSVSKLEQKNTEIWIAENDSVKIKAESPIELLGLVSMVEYRGKDWKASDAEIDTFLKKFNYET